MEENSTPLKDGPTKMLLRLIKSNIWFKL